MSRGHGEPRIFATLVWGFDPDWWGALCFRDRVTLNRLMHDSGPDDLVLVIGSMHKNVEEAKRGRLLGLLHFEPVLKPTRLLVDPDMYEARVRTDGEEKWRHAFPITGARKFKPPRPVRAEVLPRLHEQNLHISLARHFQALLPDEAATVLSFPLEEVPRIYRAA